MHKLYFLFIASMYLLVYPDINSPYSSKIVQKDESIVSLELYLDTLNVCF